MLRQKHSARPFFVFFLTSLKSFCELLWLLLLCVFALQGVKEERREPAFSYKAGWLKKDAGRLLSSFKDCYVHVEKTELVLYDNEVHELCFPTNAASLFWQSYLMTVFKINSYEQLSSKWIKVIESNIKVNDLL